MSTMLLITILCVMSFMVFTTWLLRTMVASMYVMSVMSIYGLNTPIFFMPVMALMILMLMMLMMVLTTVLSVMSMMISMTALSVVCWWLWYLQFLPYRTRCQDKTVKLSFKPYSMLSVENKILFTLCNRIK